MSNKHISILCRNGNHFLISLLIMMLSFSCSEKEKKISVNVDELREEMLQANRRLMQKESHSIDSFIKQRGFIMSVTGTGLRFAETKAGNGKNPVPGDEVKISYKAWLLDGKLCAEVPVNRPIVFRLGQNLQTRGLEEAILLMKKQSDARCVVPSHLAYGMKGDGNLVPGGSPLYYELTLIDIIK